MSHSNLVESSSRGEYFTSEFVSQESKLRVVGLENKEVQQRPQKEEPISVTEPKRPEEMTTSLITNTEVPTDVETIEPVMDVDNAESTVEEKSEE